MPYVPVNKRNLSKGQRILFRLKTEDEDVIREGEFKEYALSRNKKSTSYLRLDQAWLKIKDVHIISLIK